MTLQQLEQRITDLEQQIAELRIEFKLLRPLKSVQDTFGMFANDPDFDEIIRLGRKYRDWANSRE